MTEFWSLAAVMIALALLFTVPPVLRTRKNTTISPDELNTEVVKAQLSELAADLESGKLDQAQYDSARTDLERELLYDIAQPGDSAADDSRQRCGRWAALVLVPAIPLLAIWLYQQMGSGHLVDLPQRADVGAQRPVTDARAAPAHSMEELVAELAKRLENEPDNIEGWVLLARSYTSMQRFGDAANAYANIVRLGGDHPELLTEYADVLVMSKGGKFDEKAGQLLERALELDPENVKGLWLSGHWKFNEARYAEAIDYWQRAAARLPADSRNAQVIHQQIREAQKALGVEVTPVTATAAVASTGVAPDQPAHDTGEAAVSVQVQLDPELTDRVAANDTLFIYARAVTGPRMPLAIIRKQAGDIPVAVTLDDSMAMSQAMKLSKFSEVTVEARISRSGNAMTQSGDLKGTLSPVRTRGGEPVKITIDSVVP